MSLFDTMDMQSVLKKIRSNVILAVFAILFVNIFLLFIETWITQILHVTGDDFVLHFVIEISTRGLIGIIAFLFIIKLRFTKINGLLSVGRVNNPQAYLIVLIFILMSIYSNRYLYLAVPWYILSLFFINTLCVGISEELVFRGIIQPLLVRHYLRTRFGIFIGVIFASMIFGVLHLINIKNSSQNVEGIIFQAFLAINIGIFFGALVIRTGNLMLVGILHGLINFAFGPTKLKYYLNMPSLPDLGNVSTMASIVTTIILFSLIGFSGLFMIKIANTSGYLQELGQTQDSN